MAEKLRHGSHRPAGEQGVLGKVSAKVAIALKDGKPTESCARARFKVGTAELNNDAFAVICFKPEGDLSSVVSPDYTMEFLDQRPFGKKRIAYQLIADPAPGTRIVGSVELLEKLDPGTKIDSSVAEASGKNPAIIHINQDMFDKLAGGHPQIIWPPVQSGNTAGKLSMYVSADSEGHVREAYPLNSDNAGLQESVRDQLLKLQLKPAVSKGERVQTEASLTFAFSTTLASSSPDATAATTAAAVPVQLPPAELGKRMRKSYPPIYPQKAKDKHLEGTITFDAVITKTGEVGSLTVKSASNPIFLDSAITAVKQWKYHPYQLDGQPVEVHSTITVNFRMN